MKYFIATKIVIIRTMGYIPFALINNVSIFMISPLGVAVGLLSI